MVKFSKVFLDSNVIFSALYSPQGTPAEVLYLTNKFEIKALISDQVELEVLRNLKLKLPEILGEFQHLLSAGVLTLVDDVPIERNQKWVKFLPQEDALILETAIFHGCDCLVTGNTRDFNLEIEKVSGLKILTPRAFAREIRPL